MNIYRSRAGVFLSSLSLPQIMLCTLLATGIGGWNSARAQVTTSITPTTGAGDLGTSVTQAGNVYNITDGTRPENGTNLFHSFGNFSVGTGDIGNFLNTPVNGVLLPTSNILGRVTSGNISNIYGTIQTTGFENANLFLMNPAGFLFGPNATVNVGGMVAFTSADYLRLTDHTRFNAIPNAAADALLTASPVVSFGFLGSNPGAITVQGSQFTVSEGQGISLVGGDIEVTVGTLDDGITVQPARLAAPGGQFNLASVASPGEILYPSLQPGPNINGQSFINMGAISLSEGTVLDVFADAAGTIKIRGGQFVIADGTLSADTGNTNGAPVAIDVNVTGDLSITDTRGVPAMTARTMGTGDSGEIRISSSNLTATSSFVDPSFLPTTLIDSHTSGDGRGGDVHITTGNLAVSGTTTTSFFFIDSGTAGNGRGGNVTINAETVDLDVTSISTGQLTASALLADTSGVNGSAGNVTITADTLRLKDSTLDTSAVLGQSEFQKGGDITITARDISMKDTQVTSLAFDGGGTITIKADRLVTDFTSFETVTVLEQGGAISVEAHVVELTNGSSLISTTFGDGTAGNISLTATDHVKILGDLGTNPQADFSPSGLFSNSFGFFGSQGNAGNVIVTTPNLEMAAGRINTVTASSGQGGNVTLNVTDSISISGEFPSDRLIVPSIFDIGPLAPSGVVTSTVGGEFCAGPCGKAGDVFINTGSLSMGAGSHVNSGTSSSGNGGLITINASDTISMSGRLSDGSPVGVLSSSIGTEPDAGSGGEITLTAGQSVTISNGASVSASSTGPGNTGNIQIDAGNQFAMTNSSVTTEADAASGGAIKITTTPSGTVQLTNSLISASVLDGAGGGGSVDIDPQYVILLNSQILAQAVKGPGGIITINITNDGLYLPDANSVISASSQFGVHGTVTIQSPNAPASGKIQPLGKTPLQATSLLNQRCAALAGGEFSSFTVAGRDSLPTEPSSWLASPLYAAGVGKGRVGKAEGVKAEGGRSVVGGETPLLSLRQIAPAGFLTQAFALDWSAGCQS